MNTILVLGSERLHSEMQRRFSAYRTSTGESITLVKLDKSGGCVDRDDTFMQQTQEAAIKEYFFGDSKSTLSPHTLQINFDDATIYKIREGIFKVLLGLSDSTNNSQQMQCHSCQVVWRRQKQVYTKKSSLVR